MNWICRAVPVPISRLRGDVIRPNEAVEVQVEPGLPNCGLLVRLKNSARNEIF